MKLKAANLLELSLSLAFALIVLATSLQLVQEATDRINKAFSFQSFQQEAYQSLLRIQSFGQWQWVNNTPLSNIGIETTMEQIITSDYYSFNNSNWSSGDLHSELIKVTISNNLFAKNLNVFVSKYKSTAHLKGTLMTIYYALKQYHQLNQVYPPNQQLNYLTQANILNKIPNNPYTVDDITSTSKNITDWNYSNINGEITLFSYTHPNIQINFN